MLRILKVLDKLTSRLVAFSSKFFREPALMKISGNLKLS
jgi:hypothetical protein